MITPMVKGKPLKDAKKITKKAIADALGGLPPVKMHCSVLAADALRQAIDNYQKKRK
jgi:nitrogen fixation NifU-like protein